MQDILVAFIAGGALSGVISGVFSIILYKTKKKDETQAEEDVVKKALRYIMLYIIQERAKDHISRGKITVGERRALHKWHELYHYGLDGNGDADLVMSAVDELEVDYE